MTENEILKSALKKVEAQKVNFGFMERFNVDENWEVMKALEEIQQYRAIGTVDEVAEMSNSYINYFHKVRKYQAIGTIEEFKALKEKSVAKKPDYEGDGHYNGQIVFDTWICPNCEKHYEVDYDDYNYCPNCGQHIDHSGLTEDD